jgi:hypothetical protein
MTGPACLDAVSPAMARAVAPMLAPQSRQQPKKTTSKLTSLGARGSRAWEARPGGATPSRRSVGSLPRGPPRRAHLKGTDPADHQRLSQSCPNRATHLSSAGTQSRRTRALRALYWPRRGVRAVQLIETTLVKGRDFVAWRQAHPHEVVAPNARRTVTTAAAANAERRG